MTIKEKKEILAIIPARGGSKGLPGKNLMDLCGKPLIAWTIEAAMGCKSLDRVFVSTDDEKISEVSRQLGVETPFLRPEEFSGDESPTIDAVLHLLEWLKENEGYAPDYTCLLQPTSPLRTTEDIEDAILMAVESSAEALVSVTEVTMHPYLTRVMDKDNILKPIIKEDNVKTRRRQDMPDVYGINGAIYINKLDSLVASKDFVPENTVGYIMPQERSVDIDTTWDFKLAEFLLKQDN